MIKRRMKQGLVIGQGAGFTCILPPSLPTPLQCDVTDEMPPSPPAFGAPTGLGSDSWLVPCCVCLYSIYCYVPPSWCVIPCLLLLLFLLLSLLLQH